MAFLFVVLCACSAYPIGVWQSVWARWESSESEQEQAENFNFPLLNIHLTRVIRTDIINKVYIVDKCKNSANSINVSQHLKG